MHSPTPRTFLEISASNLEHNLKTVLKFISPAKLIAVVKADAYGVGIENLIPVLLKVGIKEFAISCATEAESLSQLLATSYQLPENYKIILLGDFLTNELPLLLRLGVTIPVTSITQAQAVNQMANQIQLKTSIAITIDSGMGRIGLPTPTSSNNLTHLLTEISQCKHLTLTDCYSHFPSADEIQNSFNQQQIKILLECKKIITEHLENKVEYHLANSFGLGFHQASLFDKTRLGIGHYGVYQALNKQCNLHPCLTLKSYLIAKRRLPAGHTIGYNRTYTLSRASWIGTIPAGYADGIPYALGLDSQKKLKAWVVINNQKAPIIGKVSMDYITVDLTDIDLTDTPLQPEVILLGGDEEDNLAMNFEDWASVKHTHPYDIMTSITPRVQRVVK